MVSSFWSLYQCRWKEKIKRIGEHHSQTNAWSKRCCQKPKFERSKVKWLAEITFILTISNFWLENNERPKQNFFLLRQHDNKPTGNMRPCSAPVEARDENRKEMCSLTESLSTAGPQSLLAECLYLKKLPEESSHLAWNTDGSHITAAGGFWVLCSIKKQAAWIGLSWQLGWVSVWSGRKRNTEEKRKIERES